MTELKIGELFMIGFQGPVLPTWVTALENEFGLGGIILFDYDYRKKSFENNIQSKEQLQKLCHQIHSLPSRPLVFIDQEGGKVRRLKESLGFAPLPSQKMFNLLTVGEKKEVLSKSFKEMKDLGIDVDLAPVIDIDFNSSNPDIGAVERSYSKNADEIKENVLLVDEVAREVGLGLCLKHFPGLGGATTNSHLDLTDISDSLNDEQVNMFYTLGKKLKTHAVLVSHGIVKQWDADVPVSMSPTALSLLETNLPEGIFISDDIQMQGLQKLYSTPKACEVGIRSGLHMVIIGNNLMGEGDTLPKIFSDLQALANKDKEFGAKVSSALQKIKECKENFL